MRSGLGGGGASRLREGAARWYRPASLAIALHILIPLGAHVARPLRAAPTGAPGHLPGDEQPIDLLLAEPAPRVAAAEAPAAPPGAPPLALPPLALSRPGRRTQSGGSRPVEPTAPSRDDAAAPPAQADARSPAGPDTYGVPPGASRPAAAPGLGGTPVWSIPGVIGPSAAAAAPSAPGPRNESTPARSPEAAPPPFAALASDVLDVVRQTSTPVDGSATFEVRLDARGGILSVQLKGSSDDVAWRRAVRALKQRLSTSSFPLPASLPQGATVYIDVTSTFAHPSGGKEVAKLDDAAPIVAYTERKLQDGTSNAGDLFSSAPAVGLGATLIFEGDASNLATNKRRRLRSRVRLIPGL
ncbi:hypothetical protein WMF18_19405 [Sorangium sp. So ce315]|uniref:hypothetical protein n=1 Tax=Sorangium sp. So ce315 TaxID=3133299 RepID=UPI003F6264AF